MDPIRRPLWRAFEPTDLAQAAIHARSGGIAVVKETRLHGGASREQWYLFGDLGEPSGPLPLMVDWAIRAIEASTWGEVMEGPLLGTVRAVIRKAWRPRVTEWIDRDAAYAGAVDIVSLDCMTCGACCFDNQVVLEEADMARLRESHDPTIARRISRKAGLRLLPLVAKTKACIHLDELRCGIYPFRPAMCRDFPAASEQCLTSREERFGVALP